MIFRMDTDMDTLIMMVVRYMALSYQFSLEQVLCK